MSGCDEPVLGPWEAFGAALSLVYGLGEWYDLDEGLTDCPCIERLDNGTSGLAPARELGLLFEADPLASVGRLSLGDTLASACLNMPSSAERCLSFWPPWPRVAPL